MRSRIARSAPALLAIAVAAPHRLAAQHVVARAAAATVPRADTTTRIDWPAITRADVDAIHDLLRANHPAVPDGAAGERFRDWLARGRTVAHERARSAATRADWERVLRAYTTGFRDGHLLALFPARPAWWPGFLVRIGADGRFRVVVREGDAPALGTEVVSCDGTPVAERFARDVVPYRVNADIPHERDAASPWLLVAGDDDRAHPARCRVVAADGAVRDVVLAWRAIEPAALARVLDAAGASGLGALDYALGAAGARPRPPLALRDDGDLTVLRVPSFNWWGAAADTMRALVARVAADSTRLHASRTLVIDLRGNGGGNSGWGEALARALWGERAVEAVARSFDWTVDWRASPGNVAAIEANARRSRESGNAAQAVREDALAAALRAAIARGDAYVRQPSPGRPLAPGALGPSPFARPVYVLTDHRCASACLDFMDLLRRLPGTVHVGLPTSGDALYIDNTMAPLPSGLATFTYSLKAYRHRVRGNNEWYVPARVARGRDDRCGGDRVGAGAVRPLIALR